MKPKGGRTLFVDAATGGIDLDADPVVCQTVEVAAATYERRAIADGTFSGTAAAGAAFAADAVASFDGGATWVPLSAVGNRAFAPAGRWGHVRAWGRADLAAAQAVRFGLWISRGGQPGATDLADGRCKLRVVVGSLRRQCHDPRTLEMFGIDLAAARTVVVKSRGHFRAGFDEFFTDDRIFEVDAPGLTSPVLANFPWRRLPRPVFPLDPEATWREPDWAAEVDAAGGA